MKHFLTTLDFGQQELQEMLDLAKKLKLSGGSNDLSGKVLTAIFYNPSLRTLLSFQTGMQKLGGICNVLDMDKSRKLEYKDGVVMDGDASEHIKEFIQVICSYSDVIAVRKSDFIPNSSNKVEAESLNVQKEEMLSDTFLKQIQKYASKPIINMESNMFHPCQSLADMLTMQELLGEVKKKKYVLSWAPHPNPLPLATPHSQIITPSIFGMDVTLACPPEFKFDSTMLSKIQELADNSGGSFSVSHDQQKALEGAEIVCAKSWLSLENFGDWEKERLVRDKYKDWTITNKKMSFTNNAKFMHCLPVRRNVVVADDVLDSDQSVVIDEAENRMWAQMGMLHYILTPKS